MKMSLISAAGTWSADADISDLASSTSAELLAVLSDPTGTGLTVFGTDPVFSASIEIDGALNHDGSTVGFYGTTPVAQPASAADLTNSVTAGGTNDTIDDWANLITYATDAAAIRNAVHQLARKLKQVNDGLRDLGLLT